uniref:Uncharacterized protein n=1 Tax=Leptobrachium leishanense TaxID=445787 RepID=A0A8C5LM73_9ANUR
MASSKDLSESEEDLVDVMKIKEFDPEEMKKTMSFLTIDFQQYAAEENQKNAAIRQQLGKSYNIEMRSEAARLKSFLSYKKLSSWCPKLMASAGFYFTGVEHSVQCFCCGLVFCSSSLRTPPYEDHVRHNPNCDFIQGKDVGNIPKYEVRVQLLEINHKDLKEFITEESRVISFGNWPFYARIQAEELARTGFFFTGSKSNSIFQDVDVRLDSFKRWPENSHINPADLARAGFYYTGISDAVKCFSCGISLYSFEPEDDPYIEHMKHSSSCEVLCTMTHIKPIQGEAERQVKPLHVKSSIVVVVSCKVVFDLSRPHGQRSSRPSCPLPSSGVHLSSSLLLQ